MCPREMTDIFFQPGFGRSLRENLFRPFTVIARFDRVPISGIQPSSLLWHPTFQ